MDAREQKGMQIAATRTLQKKGGAWLVPSQSGKGRYTVFADAQTPHCTCPDHVEWQHKCKHIFAVEFALKREANPDGSETVTDSVKITERKTYPQNWKAYNAAQTNEKAKFQQLLHDLCKGIVEKPVANLKGGRPRLSLADAVFAVAFKIYSTFSGRRFMTDLSEAHAKGYLTKLPHFNSIFNYLDNVDMTPVLRDLITETSRPLKNVEVDFAADSSGFTTSRFIRWFDHKYGVVRQQHSWVKVHIMCGVMRIS